MKQHKLKRILLKEGIIATVVVALFSGVALFAGDLAQGIAEQKRKEESAIKAADNNMQQLQRDYQKADSSLILFSQIIQAIKSEKYIISRDKIRDVLVGLREKYRLSNLNLTVSPKLEYAEKSTEHLKVVYSAVQIELGGLSDSHIYNFTQELIDTLGGVVHFNNFVVERKKSMTVDILTKISQGAEPEMVSGVLQFNWYGIEVKEGQELSEDRQSGA